jgi:hypothetical protein
MCEDATRIVGTETLQDARTCLVLQAGGIENLRSLHVQLDEAVVVAYDWSDLPLDHDFYDTTQGHKITLPSDPRAAAGSSARADHARARHEGAQSSSALSETVLDV